MSKIALSGNPSGTATYTIASPAGSTDRTLTLPDNSGTVATTADIPAVASTAAAQAGTNNTNFITPLRMREGFNATGSAPVYACRAWVNFNGTGTVAIRASGNVSSITDNGAGDYTVNFTNAMSDANYCAVCSDEAIVSTVSATVIGAVAYTTSSVTIRSYGPGGQRNDPTFCNVAIFR